MKKVTFQTPSRAVAQNATTFCVLLSLCLSARATIVVHDPGLTAKTAADEVVNFAKWAKTEVDAAQIELNTLRTYENTVCRWRDLAIRLLCGACRALARLPS